MSSSNHGPKEYRVRVNQEQTRSITDPHDPAIRILHAYVRISDFPHGKLPDDINPRKHEKLRGRIPKEITKTVEQDPKWFHLLNRGLLIIAQKAWYDNKTGLLHFVINSEQDGGLADGATTDRVIAGIKRGVSQAEFEKLTDDEIPDNIKDAYVHLEIISGTNGDILIPLTAARNTSVQVQEFALEELGGGYEVLKEEFNASRFKEKIRYKENDVQPVDIRTILGILTLFHPQWEKENKQPLIAYTSKGAVLDHYRDDDWKKGFQALAPVAVDILNLYCYVHLHFQEQYQAAFGTGSKLGKKSKEIRYNKGKKAFLIALSGEKTVYGIPEGWVYPLLASFRLLLKWPKNGRGVVTWISDPIAFFDKYGFILVEKIVEQSESLGYNPNATGKNKFLWSSLLDKVKVILQESKQDEIAN